MIASVAYIRSPSGEPTRITREDGSYVLVDYDPALRVERERYFDAADVIEEELAYTYDADGNRTSRTQTLGGGPPVTETYVYGPGSELLRVEVGGVPTQEFTYDAGGRVTRIVRDGRDLTFTYDADDHVVAIDEAGTGQSTRFAFDAEGRRTERQVFAGAVLLSAMAFATAPGLASGLDSPHLTDDGAGGAAAGYVYEGEHALARFDAGSTEPVYFLRDAMGSVIGLVDQSGSSTGRVHYDGFGNERRVDGGLAGLPVEGGPRFQGMWEEAGAGYYVRARRYDPRTGRFFSHDGAGGRRRQPDSFHTYAFAGSAPFRSRDPSGRVFFGETEVAALGQDILQLQASAAASLLLTAAIACAAVLVGNELAEGSLGQDTTGPCNPPGRGWFVRFGEGPESPAELQADASRARASGFPFGVSVRFRQRISGRSDRAARRAPVEEVYALFSVEKTGRAPDHYTVHLPDPVDPAVAVEFNLVFRVR
ncbi:MAG: hypothetical protein H6674_10550 [Dehalococcoidia bacterium]|nr:hypothetical protein [Dehalococcoidia bacterium]